MRINHNLMAMNTNRQLGISNKAGAKSMEKLSSGFRINRAADDAAGLSISEKMRNQIRGLERASANSQDGISLIQTAEGALDETHAILKRMRELTVQAGNEGTLQQDDLEAIRDEFKELSGELTGISERTEFNGKKLLDGSYKGTLQIGANQKQQLDLNVAVEEATGTESLKDTIIVKGETKTEVQDQTIGNIKMDAIKGTVTVADKAAADLADGAEVSVDVDGNVTITVATEDSTTEEELKAALDKAGIKSSMTGDGTATVAHGATATADNKREVVSGGSTSANDLGVSLATNVEKDADGKVTNLDDVLKAGTFFGFEGMSQTDVKTATDANLERLDAANKAVSKVRSHLGANQNRLEHTIRNLDNAAENIQASESRIRDVDMAKEMIENTKQNILQQASTAMLAQANQAPQSVLRLLG